MAKTKAKTKKTKVSVPSVEPLEGGAGGRPTIELTDKDWKTLEGLCELHCTGEECAGILDIDYDTLNARIHDRFGISFSEYFSKKSAPGKISLRRMQFAKAKKGETKMLIHLGKHWLQQHDKNILDHQSSDGSVSLPNDFSPDEAQKAYEDMLEDTDKLFSGLTKKPE